MIHSSLALDTYLGPEVSNCTKHGFIDAIGQLSRMLFGTHMNEDVEQLRERYNQLISMASAHNKAIHLNCRNIAKLEKHVSDLALYTNQLKSALSNALVKLSSIYGFMVLHQALPALENAVYSLLHTNQFVIQEVVDAAHGLVTSALFPVRDFFHVLDLGKREYKLTPLFDLQGIHHYYPLLESVLTSDAIIVHVPFQSLVFLKSIKLNPFLMTPLLLWIFHLL